MFQHYIPKRQDYLRRRIYVETRQAIALDGKVERDKLPTINSLLYVFNKTKNDYDRKMYAAEIEFARRCFENDDGRKVYGTHENSRGNSGNGQRAIGANTNNNGVDRTRSEGNLGTSQGHALIVDGEKDDSKKLWREMRDAEVDRRAEVKARAEKRREEEAEQQRGADNARASSMSEKAYSISGSNSRSANSKDSPAQKITNIFTGNTPANGKRKNIRRILEDVTAVSIQWGKIAPSLNAICDQADKQKNSACQRVCHLAGNKKRPLSIAP